MSTVSLPLLDQVFIAKPCPARWEDMKGDDVTRHCSLCDLNVYNLSAMARDQAESFLAERQGKGRMCVGFFRRADGTILTQDCPVGIALWKKRALRAVGRIAAAALFLLTGGAALSHARQPSITARLRTAEPFRSVCEWFNPTIAPAPLLPCQTQNFAPGDTIFLTPQLAAQLKQSNPELSSKIDEALRLQSR